MKDIYFDKNYGKLYEKADNGKAQIFEFENEYGKISNQFLIREIPEKIDGKTYYDLITPYGYGGPIIENLTGNKEKLISEFENEFSKYAKENNIVSEFVRFHPIIKNYEDFGKMYNSIYMRKTLGTNIEKYDDPVQAEFSKSSRKTIRQILKQGVTYRIIENPENLDEFKRIYYLNMERKSAEEYYFFDDNYFNLILKNFKNNIILAQSIYENYSIRIIFYM